MAIPPLILDILVLGIITLCVVLYARKGFVSGILSLLGTVISFFAALWASRFFAPHIFDNFFRKGIEENIATTLATESYTSVGEFLNSILEFLPKSAISFIEENLQATLDFASPNIAAQVMTEVVRPLIVPLIAVILFLILFALLRVLVGFLSKLAKGLKHVPVVNSLNKFLGAVVGLITAALYIYLAFCILWAYDYFSGQELINNLELSNSVAFRLFSHVNFLANM